MMAFGVPFGYRTITPFSKRVNDLLSHSIIDCFWASQAIFVSSARDAV